MENLAHAPSRHLLPALPYAHADLEPHIDARTMALHHDKCHASHVAALNTALQSFPHLRERSAPWLLLNPGQLPRAFRIAIVRNFGSRAQFKQQFAEASGKLFGSGWTRLVRLKQEGGSLQVCTTPGSDNPLSERRYPMLVNNLWEPAYYLKHENRRDEYLDGWWSIANWKEAERRFECSASCTERLPDSEVELLLPEVH